MSIPGSATTEGAGLALIEAPPASTAGLLRRLGSHTTSRVGIVILAVLILASILGPLVFRANPTAQNLSQAFLRRSAAHPLGTDDLGRDELVRLFYGARFTLSLAAAAVAIGLVVGVPVGAMSGYFGGWVDLVVQRVVDVMLAFPSILLAISLVAALGVGLRNVIISVAVVAMPGFIRLVRASALSIRELPYVEAARALGVPSWRILLRHVLPNSTGPLIVQASLQLGAAILIAAGLGFLGLGVQQPTPEWGAMLGFSHTYIFSDPGLVTFPGLCICAAVLGFNLLGDGLRDALDPRMG